MEQNTNSTLGDIKFQYTSNLLNKDIESFLFNEEKNQIEIVYRKKSNEIYACNPPCSAPDKVWKEIYGVENGKIKLLKEIIRKYNPPQYIQQEISFDYEK